MPGPYVALASFPGSGNTWLRYLLQQATGTPSHLQQNYKYYCKDRVEGTSSQLKQR